jgi:hypothetical protein
MAPDAAGRCIIIIMACLVVLLQQKTPALRQAVSPACVHFRFVRT